MYARMYVHTCTYVSIVDSVYMCLCVVYVYMHNYVHMQFAYQLALISEGEMKVAQDMYDVCKGFLDLHLWPLAFPVCQLIESFVLESMERTLNRSAS